jgi:hypothetical protein
VVAADEVSADEVSADVVAADEVAADEGTADKGAADALSEPVVNDHMDTAGDDVRIEETDPEDDVGETAAVVTTGDQSAADPNWRKMTLRTGDQAFTVTVYDDRIDPFIACYDILLVVGVGSSHFRREMKFPCHQIGDMGISEMTPPKVGGKNAGMHTYAVPFVRLSKFIPFINTVKKAAPLRNLFNGSAVRYLAGDPTLAHDTAAIGAAHALLADLAPANFMCLFGDASRRATAGEDVPAISIARAATAPKETVAATMGATAAAHLPPTAGPSETAANPKTAVSTSADPTKAGADDNLKLVVYNKELDLEKDRPGFMDHAHGMFMEKLHEGLRVHCEKVNKDSAARTTRTSEDVAAHAAKADKDVAAHAAKVDKDAAAHTARTAEDVAARIATLAAEDQAKAAEHARAMAMMQMQMQLQAQMAANNAQHVSNRDHGDRGHDAKRRRRSPSAHRSYGGRPSVSRSN